MLKTQARSAANVFLILFPSPHSQKDPYYCLQNNCMWVWLAAEFWQDCSIIFSSWWLAVAESAHHPCSWWGTGNAVKQHLWWLSLSHSGPQKESAVWWWWESHYVGGRGPHLLTRLLPWRGLLLAGSLHSWLPWEVTNASSSLVVLQFFHMGTNNIDKGDLEIAKMYVKGSVDSVQQHKQSLTPASEKKEH